MPIGLELANNSSAYFGIAGRFPGPKFFDDGTIAASKRRAPITRILVYMCDVAEDPALY